MVNATLGTSNLEYENCQLLVDKVTTKINNEYRKPHYQNEYHISRPEEVLVSLDSVDNKVIYNNNFKLFNDYLLNFKASDWKIDTLTNQMWHLLAHKPMFLEEVPNAKIGEILMQAIDKLDTLKPSFTGIAVDEDLERLYITSHFLNGKKCFFNIFFDDDAYLITIDTFYQKRMISSKDFENLELATNAITESIQGV